MNSTHQENIKNENWDFGMRTCIRNSLKTQPCIAKLIGENFFYTPVDQCIKDMNFMIISINSMKKLTFSKARASISISIRINQANISDLDTIINEIKSMISYKMIKILDNSDTENPKFSTHEINLQDQRNFAFSLKYKDFHAIFYMIEDDFFQTKTITTINYDVFIITNPMFLNDNSYNLN